MSSFSPVIASARYTGRGYLGGTLAYPPPVSLPTRLSDAELLTESGTIVEAADPAGLDAALERAGLAMHTADGDRRLVHAEPEVVARAAMADGVVLRRLAVAEDAGLERLFFELTTSGGSTPSPDTDPIHPELTGATA